MGHSRLLIAAACGFAAVWIVFPEHAEAQRNRRGAANQALRRIQRDIQEVQTQLRQAQEDLGKAAKELAKAQTDYKQAQSELQQAHKTLHARIGPQAGLPDALARKEQAQADYDKASSTLIGQLRNDEEFQRLKQKLSETEERLASLRKDKPASAAAGKDQLAGAAKDALQAREAYSARIDNDPAVRSFREKLTASEEHLAEVRARLNQASKTDTDLHTAELRFKQAKGALEQAQAVAEVTEAKIAALQERLAANYALLGR